jgi:hypothetical protein
MRPVNCAVIVIGNVLLLYVGLTIADPPAPVEVPPAGDPAPAVIESAPEASPEPSAGEVQERAVPVQKGQVQPEMLAEVQQAENALRSIKQGRLTAPQLRQMLLNHPDPSIRTKAQRTVSGAPGTPRQSGGEPSDSQVERQEAEQDLKRINQGRLTTQQLRHILLNHPDPVVRKKAQEAQRVQPFRSGFNVHEPLDLLSFLWNFVNPFVATEAHAQLAYSVRLTPQTPFSPLPNNAYMSLYGASLTTTSSGATTYLLKNESCFRAPTQSSGPPMHNVKVIQTASGPPGWYLIDFYGAGGGKATLHGYNFYGHSYFVWQAWSGPNTSAGGLGSHYVTVEYFTQGPVESLFFSVDQGSFTFAEVLIEKF